MAVLALGELLHVLGVLLGGERLGHSGNLVETDISGETADLAGDSLHALLGLHDGTVDVVDALNDVQKTGGLTSLTPLAAGRDVDSGGEEEGKTQDDQQGDDDHGDVELLVVLITVDLVATAVGGSAVAGVGSAIRRLGSAIRRLRGAVRGGGSGVSTRGSGVSAGGGRSGVTAARGVTVIVAVTAGAITLRELVGGGVSGAGESKTESDFAVHVVEVVCVVRVGVVYVLCVQEAAI